MDIISWLELPCTTPITYYAMQFSEHLASHGTLDIAPQLDIRLAGKGR
jgi:hypothetical protein